MLEELVTLNFCCSHGYMSMQNIPENTIILILKELKLYDHLFQRKIYIQNSKIKANLQPILSGDY